MANIEITHYLNEYDCKHLLCVTWSVVSLIQMGKISMAQNGLMDEPKLFEVANNFRDVVSEHSSQYEWRTVEIKRNNISRGR